jgi:predicted nucleic acid-binding Zn ribbon protein
MLPLDEDDFAQVLKEAQQRQRFPRAPVRIADVMSRLLARKGYAQLQQGLEWEAAWSDAAGDQLSKNSRVGKTNRGVLEITARNSAVLQELTFQKRQLLKKLQAAAGANNLRDLRFRVGEID